MRKRVLSDQQKAEFESNGYLVVPSLVPDELCDRVIDAIMEYAGVDLENEDSWYQPVFEGHGIVPLHHHQALWDLRQFPPVHEVFADLYGTTRLWVSNDRVSYKPPLNDVTELWQMARIHWDCDPWTFKGLSMQGLVYLTDTEAEQGAFTCAPDVYRNLQAYLTEHEDDQHRRYPELEDSELVPVPGPKGSLVVFNRLMPHTSGINRSSSHRFVQYVTMMEEDEAQRETKVAEWKDKRLPDWAIAQEISRGKTHEDGEAAQLTELGRKLVGLDRW